MNHTITLAGHVFTVRNQEGEYFIEANAPLHHMTWKKAVRELGVDVVVGCWNRGFFSTYDKIKIENFS